MKLIALALGGAIGALLRLFVNNLFVVSLSPVATMIENLSGSLILGLLTGVFMNREAPEWLKIGLGTGVCGGFTTMSTFIADIFTLFEVSAFITVAYLMLTITGGLLCVFMGLEMGRKINSFPKKGENL